MNRNIVNAIYKRVKKVVIINYPEYQTAGIIKNKIWGQLYCKAVKKPLPIRKDFNLFLWNEYNSVDSPIYKLIKLPVKHRKKKITAKDKLSYKSYLKSAKWRTFKQMLFDLRGHKCEKCGEIKGAIDGHHKTYIRLFNELPEDIILLCRVCHKRVHGIK